MIARSLRDWRIENIRIAGMSNSLFPIIHFENKNYQHSSILMFGRLERFDAALPEYLHRFLNLFVYLVENPEDRSDRHDGQRKVENDIRRPDFSADHLRFQDKGQSERPQKEGQNNHAGVGMGKRNSGVPGVPAIFAVNVVRVDRFVAESAGGWIGHI